MKGKYKDHEWNPDLGLAILAARGGSPHTEETIAAFMGLSRQRVNQIIFKAIRKIRFRLERQQEIMDAINYKRFDLK